MLTLWSFAVSGAKFEAAEWDPERGLTDGLAEIVRRFAGVQAQRVAAVSELN